MERWCLLTTGFANAYENMAIDEAIFRSCCLGLAPPTIRFYGWSPPAISLGYFQKVDDSINLAACHTLGIDVVRRLTGGRAVFHDKELTYSVICPRQSNIFPNNLLETYKIISSCLIEGLKSLNVDAHFITFRKIVAKPGSHSNSSANCFLCHSWHDIAVNGKKICGSAQRRAKNAFLQHGSILLDFNAEKLSQILVSKDGEGESSSGEAITSLREHLTRKIDFFDLERALIASFEQRLNIELEAGHLMPQEEARRDQCLAEKYLRESWNLYGE